MSSEEAPLHMKILYEYCPNEMQVDPGLVELSANADSSLQLVYSWLMLIHQKKKLQPPMQR